MSDSLILVTGGAGFIGSAVIRHIISNTTDSIVNVDKLTYAGNLESLAEASQSPRYAFERVDICDRDQVDRVLREHQPDAIMHLAAESHVDRSISGPGAFLESNVLGTFQMRHDSAGMTPGGLVELTPKGERVRSASANAPGLDPALGFALLGHQLLQHLVYCIAAKV